MLKPRAKQLYDFLKQRKAAVFKTAKRPSRAMQRQSDLKELRSFTKDQ